MSEIEQATLAGGCFWCIEAATKELPGVKRATSGYTGGHVASPTYEEVCSGETGHAEAVQIEYDPSAISFLELLEVFFSIHDPTTKDRQGPDVGSQYRSAVFYHSERQRELTEQFVDELESEGVYEGIVTEIEPLETFYRAEEYHQDYFEKHPDKPYCAAHVRPKVQKVKERFVAEEPAD